jgi:hypothetical protein
MNKLQIALVVLATVAVAMLNISVQSALLTSVIIFPLIEEFIKTYGIGNKQYTALEDRTIAFALTELVIKSVMGTFYVFSLVTAVFHVLVPNMICAQFNENTRYQRIGTFVLSAMVHIALNIAVYALMFA